MIDATGAVDTVSFDWPRKAFTEEYRQRQIQQMFELFGEQETVRELYGAMPKPDSLLAYSRLIADTDDRAWLGIYDESDTRVEPEPPEWLVVDYSGRMVGTVTMPDGLKVTDIGHGILTGVVTDELGVEQVRAYRILGSG